MGRLGGLLASAAMFVAAGSGAASAAGFQRGIADTDILYEPGMFSARFGMTYVSPERGFSSIEGVSGDYGQYTGTYRLPSPAIKFGNGPFACAGTYIESFAAEANYSSLPGGAQPVDPATGSRVQSFEFDSNEWGVTCRASYDADIGRFSLLGGVFFEDFNFAGTSFGSAAVPAAAVNPALPATAALVIPVSLSVDARGDYEPGYRIGVAYEKPEIALRAQILYRSEVTHSSPDGTGVATVTGPGRIISASGATLGIVPESVLPTLPAGVAFLNDVVSPQSLYVNFQTGIAEDTLLLANFRWTDWSTNRDVLVTYRSALGVRENNSPYYWDDGYSFQIGLGRAFNEEISAVVMLGYDSGVSTGAETTYTDLYTVSGGVSFKQNFGEIRVGGLVGYWTDGSQSVDRGAIFNAEVDNDWVYAATASFKLNF